MLTDHLETTLIMISNIYTSTMLLATGLYTLFRRKPLMLMHFVAMLVCFVI